MSHSHNSHIISVAQTQVLLQPTQSEVLPDNNGNVPGEIPPDKAAEILKIINEFKKHGRIPQEADEHQLMLTMHQEMLKEQQMIAMYNSALSSAAPSTFAAPLKSAVPPRSAGHVAIPMHPSSADVFDEEEVSTENLLSTVTTMLRQNHKAINDKDAAGDTLLHRVCSTGQDKLAHLLLVNGANVNATNSLNQTPFHVAAQSGQIMTMHLLTKNAAEVNAVDVNGWTALHHAAASSAYLSPQSLVYLTECCSLSLSARTNDGQSVLHIVAISKKDNNRLMLPMLLNSADLDVCWVDKSGSNAMHYAVEHDQGDMCYKFACKRGAKLLLVTNKAGRTPIDIAKNLTTLEGFYLAQQMESWVKRGPNYKPSEKRPSIYYQLLFAPAVILACGLMLTHYFTPNFQGFISLASLIACVLLVSRNAARIDKISRLADPSRLGGFITGMICVIYINTGEYATHRLPERNRVILLVFLYVAMIIAAMFFYLLITRDPGFTYESKRKENGEFYTMKDLVALERPSVWCPVCELIPTKPSKHCKQCDRCVYWLDHHCLYTMKCVGCNNHYIFIWFTILVVIIQIITLGMLPGYVTYVNSAGSELNAYLQLFMYDGFLFIVLCGVLWFTVVTLPLLVRSLNDISHGYTYYFNPNQSGTYRSGLTFYQRIINVILFLHNGKRKYIDPNFTLLH